MWVVQVAHVALLDPDDAVPASSAVRGVLHAAPLQECGWVTTRRSGVAHPICALEMLHDAEGTEYAAGIGPAAVVGGAEGSESDSEMEEDGYRSLRTLTMSAKHFVYHLKVRLTHHRANTNCT